MDASQKLRMVLDYLPCEACLAQPVADQELLCSICHRLHRQVAVRVTTRSTIILERPSAAEPAAPVVIPPAVPLVETPAPQPPREPEPVAAAEPEPALPPEIITEPYEVPADPVPVVELQDEPEPAPAPKQESRVFGFFRRDDPEPAPEPVFDDVVAYEPTEDSFEVVRGEAAFAEDSYEVVRQGREPEPSPPSEPTVLSESEPETESDFIFRPPEEAPREPVYEEAVEEWTPTEEVTIERENEIQPLAREEENPWAPPAEEIFAEEDARTFEPVREAQEPEAQPQPSWAREPEPLEEEIMETTLVEDEPLQAEIVEAEVLTAEIVEDEPAASTSDLYRLRGFSASHERALAAIGIDSIQSLAGHDPNELAHRAGLPPDTITPWVQVADLVHEVGVPVDSAIALVAAGIPGVRGMRDLSEQDILDRVEASGGVRLSGRDIKRWKRRA